MKNIGLILLSASIIIGAFIISRTNRLSEEYIGQNVSLNAVHGFNGDNNPIKLHFDSAPKSEEFILGDSTTLYVLTKFSESKRFFEGKNLVAKYFREGNLLRIIYEVNDKRIVKYIIDPIEWGTEE